MSEYKGTSVVTLRNILRDRGLDGALARDLEPRIRHHFEEVLAVEWIPIEDVDVIYRKTAPLLYPNSEHALLLLGRDLAHCHLNTVYRVLFRLATVQMIINQTARLWSAYNSRGTLTVVDSQDRAMRFVLEDYPDYPDAVREALCGYIAGTVELTGARRPRVSERAGRGGTWEFRVTWG